MPRRLSKRKKEFEKLVDRQKRYTIEEAIALFKNTPKVKFNQTIELAIKLNVDTKQTSQPVRGSVTLPHGTGKKKTVCVLCKGEYEKKAKEAGAEYVGSVDLIQKIQSGWCDFDIAITTPDMMREISKLGKILGPRGLMPNPKSGTVTEDIKGAIDEVKKGKIEFKMDKQTNIQVPIGKLTFEEKALCENALSIIRAVSSARPASIKGQFIRSIAVSSSMGPGVKLDIAKVA
ncbi:MAG: 50S ribosomal protein L1 [Candidatus Omnitrophica bacterium]|nr:50S ribosomal protein L1 [Candidatus Omnitrophota bacterium]